MTTKNLFKNLFSVTEEKVKNILGSLPHDEFSIDIKYNDITAGHKSIGITLEIINSLKVDDPLLLSIKKWECIIYIIETLIDLNKYIDLTINVNTSGRATCALCEKYFAGDECCENCPVANKSGKAFCKNTPHENAIDIIKSLTHRYYLDKITDNKTLSDLLSASKAELEFLQSLVSKPKKTILIYGENDTDNWMGELMFRTSDHYDYNFFSHNDEYDYYVYAVTPNTIKLDTLAHVVRRSQTHPNKVIFYYRCHNDDDYKAYSKETLELLREIADIIIKRGGYTAYSLSNLVRKLKERV